MKFQINFVIIHIFISLSVCKSTDDYYLEDYCREYQTLDIIADQTKQLRLYLSRNINSYLTSGHKYCSIQLQIAEDINLQVEGHLGQLVLDQDQSDDGTLRFLFRTNATENQLFNRYVLSNHLNITIENDSNPANSEVSVKLLQTELYIKPLLEDDNCDDTNDPKCRDTEEELDESVDDIGLTNSDLPISYDQLPINEDSDKESIEGSGDTTEKDEQNRAVVNQVVIETVYTSGSLKLAKNELSLVTLIILLELYFSFN